MEYWTQIAFEAFFEQLCGGMEIPCCAMQVSKAALE